MTFGFCVGTSPACSTAGDASARAMRRIRDGCTFASRMWIEEGHDGQRYFRKRVRVGELSVRRLYGSAGQFFVGSVIALPAFFQPCPALSSSSESTF
jgi:hypothetical protein